VIQSNWVSGRPGGGIYGGFQTQRVNASLALFEIGGMMMPGLGPVTEPASGLSRQLELGLARVEPLAELAVVILLEIELLLVIEPETGLAHVTGLAHMIEPVTALVLVLVIAPGPGIVLALLLRKPVARAAQL
jgi:hypothetical protein